MRDAILYFEQLGESYGRTLAKSLRLPPPPPARNAVVAPLARRAVRVLRPARAGSGIVVGAQVRYRQGRGTFDAEVIRVDAITGTATLQRISDGKRVVRPLDRIYR